MRVNDLTDTLSDDYSIPKDGLMTFEEALEKVGGGANRYQVLVFIYFGLQWMIANWILTSPVYLFVNPTVVCPADDLKCLNNCVGGDAFGIDKCEKYICNEINQDLWSTYLSGKSLITEFDPPLVCDKKYISSTLQSLVYAGSLLGFFIFSFVADNYGRKLGLGLSWFSATIGGIILAFSVSVEMIGIGIFLCGFGVNPAITIQYSFINEHTQGKFREYQNAGVQIFFGVGEMFLVLIAYYFQEWRNLAVYWMMIPLILLNIPILFLQESPKYMYSKNKIKAVMILNRIAKWNKKNSVMSTQIQNCKLNQLNMNRVFSVVDLFRYGSLRLMFICGFLIFLSMQLVFYGINFVMQEIGLNLYINAIVIAAFETLGYITSEILMTRLRRRNTIFMGFFGACLVCFVFVFLKKPDDCGQTCSIVIIQLILAGLIRFTVTTVWAFSYTHLSELFPTVVRSLALGLISAGGTIGSIMSPFVGSYSQDIGLQPLISLGIVGLIGSLFVLPLRETFGCELKDEIEEDVDANRTTFRTSEDPSTLYKSA